MPGINGLEVSTKIQEYNSNIHIVFITGYDQYAIEAFELFALDYILKPVQKNRLLKTLDRLSKLTLNQEMITNKDGSILLNCFDEITFVCNSEELPVKWRTKKALELFAYLLHHRNRFVSKDSLIEMFWSDFDPEKTNQQLYTTIYHIRNSLKKANINGIEIKSTSRMENGYILELDERVHFLVDNWADSIQSLDQITGENHKYYMDLFHQYTGDLFGSYQFNWAAAEVDIYRQHLLQLTEKLSEYYVRNKQCNKAVDLYQQVQVLCPQLEISYFQLMKLYDKMKLFQEIEDQFNKLVDMMEEEYDLPPSIEIYDWYQNYRKHLQRYS
ncbi:response regulator [Gracilibacillus oryzae]|uniref:Response regulator n=2 Tax=Gracilibacillus oryzae TaxID=1672701 RepID=A0A7C8L9X6_9BACI|nr:response regulator [Gracilibacillus oryzae]